MSMNTFPLTTSERIAALEIGSCLIFPSEDYWRVNSARQRASERTSAKFVLRRKGKSVYVVRVK